MAEVDPILTRSIVEIGGAALTVGALLKALLILLGALILSWMVRRFSRRMQVRVGEERASAVYIAAQVARYLVIIAGFAIAISALGVDLTALSLFAGALGVGIGLGLQEVVRNFVSGLILLFDRSVEVGDFIELDGETRGTVTGIGPRAITVVTNDEVDILVPNADMLNGRLKNWTRNRTPRRIRVPFSVAYESDKELVRRAALEAAAAVPFTMPEHDRYKSQVWLVGFGDSSLDFELVVWPTLEAVKRPGTITAAYRWALHDALCKHGLEIPFPQRELRFRDGSVTGGEKGAMLRPSVNDAADDATGKGESA